MHFTRERRCTLKEAFPLRVRGPALGVLEIATIARGVVAADAGLKRAPAVLVGSRAVSGGKHLVMFEGGVAEVEEALAAGLLAAGDKLLDRVWLPAADAQVWPLLGAPVTTPDWAGEAGAEAVAIIETMTVCAAIASPPTRRARSPRSRCATRGSRLDLAGKRVLSR